MPVTKSSVDTDMQLFFDRYLILIGKDICRSCTNVESKVKGHKTSD